MKFDKTHIEGVWLIKPQLWEDERGYFMETFHREKFYHAGLRYTWVQDNEAMSNKGVLRGLHFQIGEHAQAKLVRVIRGSIFDVAVDLRPQSPTYGQYVGVVLSDDNKYQLLIPRGFAHGYLALEDNTIVSYKCDNYYAPQSERGIHPLDDTLSIQWPTVDRPYILSAKDQQWPAFLHKEAWML